MPATKRGVYHNLRESKYTVSNSEAVFFFSSEAYLRKFLESYKPNRLIFLRRFAKIVVENPYNPSILADINTYLSIEKRGFYVQLKGVEISCQDLYLYALREMTNVSTKDWLRIQKPKLGERLRIMESTYPMK